MRGTNMAAANQQKHLFLSFTYAWITWGGGGVYSLIRAYWGRAAIQGMFFGIFVLNRLSILSFFVLIRVSIL